MSFLAAAAAAAVSGVDSCCRSWKELNRLAATQLRLLVEPRDTSAANSKLASADIYPNTKAYSVLLHIASIPGSAKKTTRCDRKALTLLPLPCLSHPQQIDTMKVNKKKIYSLHLSAYEKIN